MKLATTPDRRKQFVFVEIVELGNVAKVFALASHVRLDTINCLYSVWPQSWFYPFKSVFVFCSRIVDGKFYVAFFDIIKACDFYHCVNRMIEARTQIVKSVSYKKGELARNGNYFLKTIKTVFGIGISLESDRVGARFSCHEAVISCLKIEDTRVGPVSF